MTENYLFTEESVREYLDYLTDEGRLIVVAHEPMEVIRLLSVSMAALEGGGITGKAAMDHVYAVGSHGNSLFVLGKNPIRPEESYLAHQAAHRSPYQPDVSYFPYVKSSINPTHLQQKLFDECQMLNPALAAVGDGRVTLDKLEEVIATAGIDVGTVTDNRPFFYYFEEGMPKPLAQVLWLASILFSATVLAPYVYQKRRFAGGAEKRGLKSSSRVTMGFIMLFSMLGLGFMLAEVSLILRFTLFVGEPVLSVTVLLFSILTGAGIGGLASGRFSSNNSLRGTGIVTLVISIIIVAYAFLVPLVFIRFQGLSLPLRALISGTLLLPLGFTLGLPFPLCIRLLKEKRMETRIPWMWGINGAASVLGSVVAMAVATKFGLTQALLVGAACYLMASFAFMVAGEGRASSR